MVIAEESKIAKIKEIAKTIAALHDTGADKPKNKLAIKNAGMHLRKVGIEPEPGQSVRYVVCNEKNRNPWKRVCIAENLENNDTIDVDFYLRQIAQYAESILIPFDFTLEKFYEMLQKIKYREIYNVSILPGIRTHQTSI